MEPRRDDGDDVQALTGATVTKVAAMEPRRDDGDDCYLHVNGGRGESCRNGAPS